MRFPWHWGFRQWASALCSILDCIQRLGGNFLTLYAILTRCGASTRLYGAEIQKLVDCLTVHLPHESK